MGQKGTRAPDRTIWPTLTLIAATTALWVILVFGLAQVSVLETVVVLAPVIALHASLQHEVIHGHPFANRALNAALVSPAFTLVVPYLRFEATHLAHHNDARLTDPYDDPESQYLDPAVFETLPGWVRGVLRVNNTFAGRVALGPLIGLVLFLRFELLLARAGDRSVWRGWAWHLPSLAVVVALVAISPLSLWAYAVAAYGAMSILKVRTFLEHQAHEHSAARSVIIEDRGPLAFLFLNNNLHVVHHMHPDVPWYDLPALYRANKARYLERNGGYRYRSYAEVMRRYLWRGKEPVAHPLWQKDA